VHDAGGRDGDVGFNIVVETQWKSNKIGGKRGGPKGKRAPANLVVRALRGGKSEQPTWINTRAITLAGRETMANSIQNQ
jgi:hypothetical protein